MHLLAIQMIPVIQWRVQTCLSFFVLTFRVPALYLFLFSSALHAQNVSVEMSRLGEEPLSLTPYFGVFEDPERTLTLSDIQKLDPGMFKASHAQGPVLNFSYTRSAFWLRLRLSNQTGAPVKSMLEIGYASLSHVQFHCPGIEGAENVATGTIAPFSTRPHKNRNFVFPVNITERGEFVCYFRLESTTPILVPARLWTSAAFQEHERNDYLTHAWYFGVVTAMVVFNLLLFISLRDIVYLLYVSFVSCFAVALAAEKGVAKQFLWPAAGQWADIAIYVGYSLAIGFGLTFMQVMLGTRRVIPAFDKWLRAFVLLLFLTPVAFFISLETFARAAVMLYTGAVPLILGVGIYCAVKRQRSAYFFVAAFTMICIGGFVTGLSLLGAIPANSYTTGAMQFGSVMEMLLLAFALADRFNQIRREKEKAQAEALKAEHLLVENLKSSEKILEERVAERTAALSDSNRALLAANTELEEKKAALEKLSITDRLTSLSNRLMLDRVLEAELHRSQRYSSTFSLILLDVDRFKFVNDTFGHPVGDSVLVELAALLSARVRDSDVVGRWGGEEFLIVCRDTSADGARILADKLRAKVMEHDFPLAGPRTSSFGVTGVCKGDTVASMIARADRALYRAKENGRNRVELEAAPFA